MDLDRLIAFYNELTPGKVERFPDFYATDAYFKDPFNEVRGLPAIQNVFAHMFRQLAEPRFVIVDQVVDENGAMLVWEFHYRLTFFGREQKHLIRGASHLKFSAEGKVVWHRDYWDAAEELYASLPFIGGLMRALKKRLTAGSEAVA